MIFFTRLTYYKKISSCNELVDVNFIKDEMIDIFGPIPEHLENLFHLTKLKIKINGLNIKYIGWYTMALLAHFDKDYFILL